MDTDGRVEFLVRGLQTRTLLRCSNDANDLRLVWVTAREVRRRHQHLLGSGVWKSRAGVDDVHRGRPGRRRGA